MSFSTFRFRVGIALITAALLPLLLLGFVALRLAESSLAETIREQHLATMNAFRGGTSLFFQQRLSRLNQLAQRPELQSLLPDRIQSALPEFLSQSRLFLTLGVFDSTGNRLGMANRAPSPILGDGPLPAGISSVAMGEGRILSDFPSTPDGQPILFVQPIPDFLDPKRTVGMLLAEAVVQNADLQEILAAFSAPPDTWVCLLDRAGTIIARQGSGLAPEAIAFELPTSFFAPSASATPGTMQTGGGRPITETRTVEVDHRGRTDLLSLTWLPELGGLIAVGRPAAEAYRLVITLREHLLLIGVFTLFLAIGLGWILAKTLSHPVIRLTEGIEQVRMGVYSHRLNSDAPDELGDAARALDALTAMLQKKMVIGSIWENLRGRGEQRRP